MTLKEVLAAKGRRVITVSARSSVADAIRTMHAEQVGSVVVPDSGACPVGIFTERDVLRMYAEGDRDFDALPVESRMTCSVMFGRLSMPVDEALGLMTQGRFRHLPVVEDGKLSRPGVDRRPGEDRSSPKPPRKRRRCARTSLPSDPK